MSFSRSSNFLAHFGTRAAPSCDILTSLRASGPVMPHFRVAGCQRTRHATFSCRCVPAGPSCDIFASLRASGPVMRHSGVAACQRPVMPHFGSLLIQRPRHAACWRYFRSSGPVMPHAGVTFDPAAPSCGMPASLLIQRPRHAACQDVRDACQVCQVPGQLRRRP